MTQDEALKQAFNSAYDVRRDWRKWNAAFLSSLRESGWTLAPVEATEKMLMKGIAAGGRYDIEMYLNECQEIYRAVVLAAQEDESMGDYADLEKRLRKWPKIGETDDTAEMIEESADAIAALNAEVVDLRLDVDKLGEDNLGLATELDKNICEREDAITENLGLKVWRDKLLGDRDEWRAQCNEAEKDRDDYKRTANEYYSDNIKLRAEVERLTREKDQASAWHVDDIARVKQAAEARAESAERKLAMAVEILTRLVYLKKERDDIGKSSGYIERKERAWCDARAALAELEKADDH
jgi:hypothetical protein